MAITNKDVDKLKEVFATKEELSSFRDEVMGGLDKVMGELGKIREDQTVALGKDREQDRRLDSLEGRMQKVEAKAGRA
jgi:hypothetical protein